GLPTFTVGTCRAVSLRVAVEASGPFLDRSISTPQTLRPSVRAALTAALRSCGVMRTLSPEPPRCRFERNSPGDLAALSRPQLCRRSPARGYRLSRPP